MLSGTVRKADARNGEWRYEHHRHVRTLLYQFVAEHYLRFVDLLAPGAARCRNVCTDMAPS